MRSSIATANAVIILLLLCYHTLPVNTCSGSGDLATKHTLEAVRSLLSQDELVIRSIVDNRSSKPGHNRYARNGGAAIHSARYELEQPEQEQVHFRKDDLSASASDRNTLHYRLNNIRNVNNSTMTMTTTMAYGQPETADIDLLNSTFLNYFMTPRYENTPQKNRIRNFIHNSMVEYGLTDVQLQRFTATKGSQTQSGANIIGYYPSKQRRERNRKVGDKLLLIGAHYDTVRRTVGIDDNASGVVAMLEIMRLLQANEVILDHSILFVCFDLEELGLLGSIAFVKDYFIPNEILARKSKFLGAYILDMLLTYDSRDNSQEMIQEMRQGLPRTYKAVKAHKFRGDFLSVWMRRGVDNPLWDSLQSAWTPPEATGMTKYRLLAFDPPLPATQVTTSDLLKYGTFTRSDHAAFWYHKNNAYHKTLNAILITDLGPWRSRMANCYHSVCDDQRQLTEDNLNFFKHTIDALYRVITVKPPVVATSNRIRFNVR